MTVHLFLEPDYNGFRSLDAYIGFQLATRVNGRSLKSLVEAQRRTFTLLQQTVHANPYLGDDLPEPQAADAVRRNGGNW